MKLPTSLRLHQQLLLVVSGLLLVAIALLGGYTAWAQHQSARQALQVQAATLARFMALSSSNLILTESLDQVESLALRIADLPDVMAIRVVDAQGTKPVPCAACQAGLATGGVRRTQRAPDLA
jgi:sensor histidine kinase regulating citrate/malate metabolism